MSLDFPLASLKISVDLNCIRYSLNDQRRWGSQIHRKTKVTHETITITESVVDDVLAERVKSKESKKKRQRLVRIQDPDKSS